MSVVRPVVVGLICFFLVIAVAYSEQSKKESQATPQSMTIPAQRAVKYVKVANRDGDKSATTSSLNEATINNSRLCTEMNWTFGGKTQHGYELYLPLICHLIGAESSFDQPDFAQALATWQRTTGLTPHGTLDQDTWSRMVATWQGRRVRNYGVANTDKLVLVSANHFYATDRPAELRYVDREAFEAYQQMVAAAASDPTLNLQITTDGQLAPEEKFLKIISAFRSPEYQAQLRQRSPGAGRAALAVHSPHFTGRALDLYVGGEPVTTKDANRALQTRTRVYQWLVKNAEKFGFYPYFYEPWHWEYRSRS